MEAKVGQLQQETLGPPESVGISIGAPSASLANSLSSHSSIHRSVELGPECFWPTISQDIIRILTFGQHTDRDIEILFERDFNRSACGSNPCGIAVKQEQHPAGAPFQQACMVAGHRGAQCGHGVMEAEAVAGEGVGVPLADDGEVLILDGLCGHVEAVEQFALGRTRGARAS